MRRLSLTIVVWAVTLSGLYFAYSFGFSNHKGNQQPPHGKNFNIECKVCHSTKGWKIDMEIYSFKHDSTAFPLIGQHLQVSCRLCHPALVFSDAKTECSQCHTDIHESTVGKDCNRCHSPQSWLVNDITRIHQQSRFPLVGVHARVDCYQCHKSETFFRFEVLGTECYSCHSQDYTSTTIPNHLTVGYSTQCTECHSIFTDGWTTTGFDHSSFPLTEGHAMVACSQCHPNGATTKPSTVCVSCHQADFNAATNPNHLSSNFSTNCTQCHTTKPGWKPATFDHSLFPLTLGHNISDCSKCHINGNYSNVSSDCKSCHQTDYNSTTNPVHSSLSFSTTCTECHTTNPGWKPASYAQHDALSFPIYSGRHRGQWNSCTDCHSNSSNYKEFNCLSCHAHNKTEMDDKHKGMTNYAYNSVSCLNCHPRGVAD